MTKSVRMTASNEGLRKRSLLVALQFMRWTASMLTPPVSRLVQAVRLSAVAVAGLFRIDAA